MMLLMILKEPQYPDGFGRRDANPVQKRRKHRTLPLR